jgi:hypothetical protein
MTTSRRSVPPAKAEHDDAESRRREAALETGLRDSSPASDPVAVVQPSPRADDQDGPCLRIQRHDTGDIVELSDGSRWRIWPGDVPTTLQWTPTTQLGVARIEDEFSSHALVNPTDKSRVRVIEASKDWPVAQVKRSLREG